MSSLIYNDILQIVKDVSSASAPTDCIQGTVMSVSPLQIMIEQTQDYYPESVYLIPEELTDYEVDIELSGDFSLPQVSGNGTFKGKMKVYNGLRVGDTVLLLKCMGGQKIYILGRV